MIDRYTLPQMREIWSLENKFQKWLDVEIYSCEAWAELGVIPGEAVEEIKKKASFTVARISEIEAETRHDVVAFTRCLAENMGDESKYVHYGLTSSDVVDTALSSLIKESLELILEKLDIFIETLAKQAVKYKETIMMGRTHGVHAEPTTFGLKIALWYEEMKRNRIRLLSALETVSYGKLSGAVGTYANIDPFVEEYVCKKMKLKSSPISTQVLQRDRHAEMMTTLAIIAGTLDKIATEIRALQKTETREVEEPFYKGQKGSSAMPHKRNPVSCEQIAGLSRIVRSNAQSALENMALWHERDISHSSVERVIVPDSTILVHYMLNRINRIIGELHVYPKNMKTNIDKTHGLTFSQRVLLTIIDKGIAREKAYDTIQKEAMLAWEKGTSFMNLLLENEDVRGWLSEDEIRECFDLTYHLKKVDMVFKRLGLS